MKHIPVKTKTLLAFGILLALFVGLPLFVWAVITQRFELRKKAAEQGSVDQKSRIVGVDANGKLTPERARWLHTVDPIHYQELLQKGLIENPNGIEKESETQSPKKPLSPSLKGASSVKLTSPSISSCGEITSGGNYTLAQDISGQDSCLSIHDTEIVNLDCQNHSISVTIPTGWGTPLKIENVDFFSVKNCNLQSQIISQSSYGTPLFIQNSSSGQIQNNKFQDGYNNISNSNNLVITNNDGINSVYQQGNSSFNKITNNTFKASANISSAGLINTYGGSNNIIQNNNLDGNWDGVTNNGVGTSGADDGIIISNESNDSISQNTISNVWDCGIENSGFLKNTGINGNKIKNAGFCGIGGWYWNSWLGNTVSFNGVDQTPYLFYMFRYFGLAQNEQTIYFKDNIFNNNTLLNQRSSSFLGATQNYSSSIDFQNIPFEIPTSVLQLGNNNFKNNDFNRTIFGPILLPTSMVSDQGGNICLAGGDSSQQPLICTSLTSPSPTPTPTPVVVNDTCLDQPDGTFCDFRCPACTFSTPKCLQPCKAYGTCQSSQCVPIPTPTATTAPSCPSGEKGNLDCDTNGLINATDLSILLANWGKQICPNIYARPINWQSPDLNGDCQINATDLSILLANWKPI